MKKIRIGVVGAGSMGGLHLGFIRNVPNLELTAVCDIDKNKADEAGRKCSIKAFYDYKEMFKSGAVEAVIISTPHYYHTPMAIDAFKSGLHVITEKPVAAHVADAERMIKAHSKYPDLRWAAMFQLRTLNIYKKLKELLNSGEFGKIIRVNYIITNSFRTQAYYDSGTWRATWNGEGGGVLLNQCPHFLDLFQWFFGMPDRISAFCGIGKYHNIEVEDDVTAYMEYPDGCSAVFITSTGDAPGTNRLEITADYGKIILENDKISITKNKTSSLEFLKTSKDGFAQPEKENIEIVPEKDEGSTHQKVIQNFADSILTGVPLIAKGEEGIHSLMLANSMLYSSLTGKIVKMPLNSLKYKKKLMELIANSKFVKSKEVELDQSKFTSSFNK